MPDKIKINIRKKPDVGKIKVDAKRKIPKEKPTIVKKIPINWATIQQRAGKKGLNSGLHGKSLSALWKTKPATWKEVDQFIVGKRKFIDEHPSDDAAIFFDTTYIENGIISTPVDYQPVTLIRVRNKNEFNALQGRYRFTYGNEQAEIYLPGGVRNLNDFFRKISDEIQAAGEVGKKIGKGDFRGITFEQIPIRKPDKTVAKRDAQRYNTPDYHCVWTPLRNYYNGLQGNCNLNQATGRKRHVRLQKLVDYFQKLSEGEAATSEQIKMVCHEKNLRIIIEYVGFDEDNIETFQRDNSHTNPADTHKYVCVRSDHLEYRYAKINGLSIMNEEDFRTRLSKEPMIHPVRLKRGNGSMEERIYSFDSYQDNKRYCIEGYESLLDPESISRKYLKWAKNNHFYPDDLPVSKLIRCAMRNPQHVAIDGFNEMDKSNLWYTDAIKAYANFRLNPLYRGVPGKIHDWKMNPEKEIYTQYAGFWYITSDDSLKYHNVSITGSWTTIALLYFISLGIKFEVIFGAWSYDWVDIPDFDQEILDKKLYSILIGLLERKGNTDIQKCWIDPEGVLDSGTGIKRTKEQVKFTDCQIKGMNGNGLASYYLDYAWTRVHSMAVKYDALAIKVDGIVTREPIPDTEGWHKCIPFIEDTTTYGTLLVNSKEHSECINPFPTALPYEYEHELRGRLKTDLYLSGAGGTGKTTTCLDQLDYIGIGYSSLAKEQVKRFVCPGKFRYGTNIHRLEQQHWLPGVIVIDEVSQLCMGNTENEVASIKWILNVADSRGIRVIFAGDRAQISIYQSFTNEDPNDMWNYLDNNCLKFEFNNNHRAKDEKLKMLLKDMRTVVLSDNPEECTDEKITKIRKIASKFKRMKKDFNGLVIGNRKQQEGEEGKYQSIDKMQGETVDAPLCVRVNGNTYRKSIFHKLVYTGFSRATSYDNVYVHDITDLKK